MDEKLDKFSVTASRTHWRVGVKFEKGKPKIVGACAVQLEKLMADPELVVEPLEEEAESISPPPPPAAPEAGEAQTSAAAPEAGEAQASAAAPEAGEAQASAAAPEAGEAQASASASTAAKPKAKTGKPKSKSK